MRLDLPCQAECCTHDWAYLKYSVQPLAVTGPWRAGSQFSPQSQLEACECCTCGQQLCAVGACQLGIRPLEPSQLARHITKSKQSLQGGTNRSTYVSTEYSAGGCCADAPTRLDSSLRSPSATVQKPKHGCKTAVVTATDTTVMGDAPSQLLCHSS